MKLKWKKRFHQKWTWLICSQITAGLVLTACQNNQPNINQTSNKNLNLAKNFDLKNLNQSKLVNSLLLTNLNTTNQSLLTATTQHLLFNWLQTFLQDSHLDPGSQLGKTQAAFRKSWQQIQSNYQKLINDNSAEQVQNLLDQFGGTTNNYYYQNLVNATKDQLINAIFSQLYLAYKKNNRYLSRVSQTELNNSSNWKNIVFYPDDQSLAIGNENYQKMFANFQEFIFDQWIKQKRPFLVWKLDWKYANSTLNSAANIYDTTYLKTQSVTVPTAANYQFPSFDVGDGNNNIGQLSTYHLWQTGVSSGTLVNSSTRGVDLKSVYSDHNQNEELAKAWKLYDNDSIANEADGYLASGIVHLYNHSFLSSDNQINPLTVNGSWDEKYTKDILNLFLDKLETNSTTLDHNHAGIWIDPKIFNPNNQKFKDKNFAYPLRDIVKNGNSGSSSNKVDWVVVKTKTGASAITLDGIDELHTKTALKDKQNVIKQQLLYYAANQQLNPNTSEFKVKLDLLDKLKDFFTKNFNSLIVQYVLDQLNNDSDLKKAASQTPFFSLNNFVRNNSKLTAVLMAIQQYQAIVRSQRELILFRNHLASSVADWKGKKFVSEPVEDKSAKTGEAGGGSGSGGGAGGPGAAGGTGMAGASSGGMPGAGTPAAAAAKAAPTKQILYAPYENGLATPLAFQRNLNTNKSDPVFQPSDTKQSNSTFTNNGDYPTLTEFYTNTSINDQANNYQIRALITANDNLSTKIKEWVGSLKNSNDGVFDNYRRYYLNDDGFNYVYGQILAQPESVATAVQNLYLANDIDFKYQTNNIQLPFASYNLKSIFTNSLNNKNLQQDLDQAIKQVFYSAIYTGSVNDVNNTKDFIGGFKVDHHVSPDTKNGPQGKQVQVNTETDNQTNINSYIDKVTSYWNQAFFSFNNLGNDLTNQLNRHYIRSLFGINWLLKDNLKNLRQFLLNEIPTNGYGAIAWVNKLNLNANANFGISQNDKNQNQSLASYYPSYLFQADPNHILTSPYFSYNLSGVNQTGFDVNTPLNYISAKALVHLPSTSTSNPNTIKYQTLSGFYGLVFDQRGFPNALPDVVNQALFHQFNQANPKGNISYNNNNPSELVNAQGKFFGSTYFDAQPKTITESTSPGQSTSIQIQQPNLQLSQQVIVQEVKSAQTFQGLSLVTKQLINQFPNLANDLNKVLDTNQYQQLKLGFDQVSWVPNDQAPVIQLSLQQKINAIINILNGHKYHIDQTNNKTLLASIKQLYDQVVPADKNYHLLQTADLARFVGSLQNPNQDQSIFLQNQYFIPESANSKIGYLAYVIQINQQDVANINNFKLFLNLLGADAFFKMVVNLAQAPTVQTAAVNDFLISKQFQKLQVVDKRLYQALGKQWAVLS